MTFRKGFSRIGFAGPFRSMVGAVLLAVFVFALAGTAQACQEDKKGDAAVSEIAGTGHRAPTRYRAALSTHPGGKQAVAVASGQAKVLAGVAHCCSDASSKCGGHGCGGACCTACFVALHPTGVTLTQAFGASVDSPFAENRLHTAELDSQFRPPRSPL